MKKIKTEFTYDNAQGFIKMVNDLAVLQDGNREEMLMIAGLSEIKQRLEKRMIQIKPKYRLQLTDVQALAITLCMERVKTSGGLYPVLAQVHLDACQLYVVRE